MIAKSMRQALVMGSLAAVALLLTGCGAETPTGIPADAQALAKREKPGGGGGGGGGGDQITPTKLAAFPRGSRCGSLEVKGLNGASPAVMVGMASCPGGTRPVVWVEGGGVAIFGGGTYTGLLSGVADDGTMVGNFRDDSRFYPVVIPAGEAVPTVLPLPPGLAHGDTRDITADGRYIVGTGWAEGAVPVATHILVWTRGGGAGSIWTVEDVAQGSCQVDEISDDGGVIVGALGDRAVAWIGADGWNPTLLPDDDGTLPSGEVVSQSWARGINGRGDVIVGDRWVVTTAGGDRSEPLAWHRGPGGWRLERLAGWNGQEGAATGVADLGGETVVVGHLVDGIHTAAAWRTSGGTEPPFGAPIRLEPLSSRSLSWATAVNGRGLVIGHGGSGSPVTWQLP